MVLQPTLFAYSWGLGPTEGRAMWAVEKQS